MFKYIIIVLVLVGLVTSKLDEEKYTTKYDNIDLETILHNDRLLDSYVKCLKDEGPCTVDGKELKDTLPDALQNGCSKCSEKQKEGSRTVINFLVENKKETWDELKQIYDPEGKYEKEYQDIIKKENIQV
uniref:CSP9 n=1 Tax=Holotrichia parallela TaxID=93412 RepID=A0A0G2YDA6_HOLPA|nr:CSP9 [Holotrichia parallela]